jgi:hypothetical protein
VNAQPSYIDIMMAIAQSDFSAGTRNVAFTLLSFGSWKNGSGIHVKLDTLAKRSRSSAARVRLALSELIAAGALAGDRKGGRGVATGYSFEPEWIRETLHKNVRVFPQKPSRFSSENPIENRPEAPPDPYSVIREGRSDQHSDSLEKADQEGITIWPLGQHRGTLVADLPDNYLRWGTSPESTIYSPRLRAALQREIEQRDKAQQDRAAREDRNHAEEAERRRKARAHARTPEGIAARARGWRLIRKQLDRLKAAR